MIGLEGEEDEEEAAEAVQNGAPLQVRQTDRQTPAQPLPPARARPADERPDSQKPKRRGGRTVNLPVSRQCRPRPATVPVLCPSAAAQGPTPSWLFL